MTKPEHTYKRDLYFNNWIRMNLPDSKTGIIVSDIDFVIMNYITKKVILLEVKAKNSQVGIAQRNMFTYFNKWIRNGITEDWCYLGLHSIVFQNISFEDGKCYFDNIETSEKDLKQYLSF